MFEQLQEINALQGVTGTFVYMKGTGIASLKLPQILQEKTIPYLNRYLARTQQINQAVGLQVKEMEIRLENAAVLIKTIDPGASLVVIGSGALNVPLINVTIEMLLDEFKEEVAKARKSRLAAAQEKTAAEAALVTKGTTLAQAMQEGPMAPAFRAMKVSLAGAVGPVSGMIFNDAAENWAKAGPVQAERLQELVDALCIEIGEPGLETQFRQKIKPLIIQAIAAGKPDAVKQQPPPQARPAAETPVMMDPGMKASLQGIQKAFTRIVGPVADMLMREATGRWQKSGPPTRQRLAGLIDMLCQEIGDPRMETDFRDQIKSLL